MSDESQTSHADRMTQQGRTGNSAKEYMAMQILYKFPDIPCGQRTMYSCASQSVWAEITHSKRGEWAQFLHMPCNYTKDNPCQG